MTITKQRVEKIIYRHEMGLNSDVTAEEVYDLAVLALNLSNIANLKRYELDIVTNGAIVIHTQRLKSDPGGNLLS
ncbi:transposase [Escherichia coli]|nr:transposase [Escherichia coli]STK49902.1 transposase [Escherichia coli]